MKAFKLIFLACCLYGTMAAAQTVKHQHYITYYNPALKEPDSVAWDLASAMVSCETGIKRKDAFKADPDIPGCAAKKDYVRSGYDRATCSTTRTPVVIRSTASNAFT